MPHPTERDGKEEPKQPKKKPEPRLPVRVISSAGDSSLVEWLDTDGMYCRVYISLSKVEEGTVATKDLERGIPYGLPWEEFIEITATQKHIANELRRQGVWCWQDMNNAALNAANRAFDKGAFLRQVNQEVTK